MMLTVKNHKISWYAQTILWCVQTFFRKPYRFSISISQITSKFKKETYNIMIDISVHRNLLVFISCLACDRWQWCDRRSISFKLIF